jgi:hypothetical protein
MDKDNDMISNTWNSELLASRLYSDKSQKTLQNNNSNKTLISSTKTLNIRGLQTSQSTPTLRVKQPNFINEKNTNNNKSNSNKVTLNKEDRNLLLKKPSSSTSNHNINNLTINSEFNNDDENTKNHTDKLNNSNNNNISVYDEHKTFLDSLQLTPKLLHDLMNIPKTFYYLESKSQYILGAYDLQLISQELIDKNNYFTISKEGITSHRHGESQFTSLHQWEREYHLYHKISSIPFFQQYRHWKVSNIFSTTIYIHNINN